MKVYQTLQKIALPNNDIRPLGFIVSALLTLLWFSKGQPINIDGITYLQLAQIYLNSGFMATLHSYGWPFYPIMIALSSKILGLSLFRTAMCLNMLLLGLITVAFVSIARTLKLSFISQCIACFLIIFFSKLVGVAGQFFRDYGFYAFMLFSFNAFLHFEQEEKYRWYIIWITSTIIASLFRIEALVFILVLPFVTLFWQSTQRTSLLVKTLGTYLLVFIVLSLTYFLFVVTHGSNTKIYTLVTTDFIHIFTYIGNSYQKNTAILKQNLLSVYGYDFAGTILISGVIGIIVVCLIKNMLPFYLFLAIYGWASKALKLTKNQRWIFAGFIFTNILIVTGFAFQHLFLSGRYTLFLSILLFIPIAPAIETFYKTYSHQLTPKHLAGYFSTFILLMLLGSMIASTVSIGTDNRNYIQSADWINQNTPTTAKVYMSDPRLTYYVKRNGTRFPEDFSWGVVFTVPEMLQSIQQKQFNYGMLITRKAQIASVISQAQQQHLTLIKSFPNNRGDQVLIFQNSAAKP